MDAPYYNGQDDRPWPSARFKRMPLREYTCPECGHRIERLEPSASNLTPPVCCGDVKMNRMPAAPAIQFKGRGWAADNYSTPMKGQHREQK